MPLKLGGLAVLTVLLTPASPPTESTATIEQVATLRTARAAHTATTLPSGHVLIVGGMRTGGGNLATAELFDPADDAIEDLGSLAEPRAGHTATLLPDGRVLIAGGYDGEYLPWVELVDPSARRVLRAGSLVEARSGHTATLLPDGRVLFVGGVGRDWTFLNTAELYDPETGRSEAAGAMAVPRESHPATQTRTIMRKSGALVVILAGSAMSAPSLEGQYDRARVSSQTVTIADSIAPFVLCQLVDAETGRPVVGAQVFFEGSRVGTLTDRRGMAVLPVPEQGTWTLATRLIGYVEERVALDLFDGTVAQVLAALRRDSTVGDSVFLAPPLPVDPGAAGTGGRGSG